MPISARAFVRSQILFLVVGLSALIAIVSVAFWLGGRSEEIADEIIAARDVKAQAVDLSAQVQRAESSQRGFLYTENEVYLAPYDLAKSAALRIAEGLPKSLAGDPNLSPAVDRLVNVIGEKFAEMDETIALARARDAAAALDLTLTNRGKALMDEANVYVTGIALAADERLVNLVSEQTNNASLQRLVSILGALVTIAAAAAGLVTIIRYAGELAEARNLLAHANADLENKVTRRTADLAKRTEEMSAAKERAELLLHEVNHRVANSLAMASSLVGLQAKAASDGSVKAVLAETQSRIQAIAMVHQRLYSSGEVSEVALDDYLRGVLEQFQSTLGSENNISVRYALEPIALRPDASINLGVIAAEWVMNAAKYAYPGQAGEVRVVLSRRPDDTVMLAVEDDGVGRGTGPAKGTGLGSRIVGAMASSLRGTVEYIDLGPGLSARLAFPLNAA